MMRGGYPQVRLPMDRIRSRTTTVLSRTIGGRPRAAGGCGSLISHRDSRRPDKADSYRETTHIALDRVHVRRFYCAARYRKASK